MLRNTTAMFALALAASLTASADFSYTDSQKATGGSMAAMAGAAADRTNKYYFKGQKMMTRSGDTATVIDFGTQTITTINNAQKTYTVKKFSDVAGPGLSGDVSFDVKDTGQKKIVNGFDATETVMTMNMDMDAGRGTPAMKMLVEMDLWVSSDVPGASEMRAFYQKNSANFPWGAIMGGGGNQSIQQAMARMQRKLADMNGAVVAQAISVKPAAGSQSAQMAQMPQLSSAQQAQMQAAMAKMQEMAKQGGPGGAAAQQAMASMGAGRGPASGGSGSLIEITVEASGFSTANLPDSAFVVPDGYQKK